MIANTNNKKTFLKKIKKTLIAIITTITIFIVVVILFISPITKYVVEKYDEEYTGRQITMDFAFVNPFTGYVFFSNVKIYEFKSDSIFLSVKKLSADFAMRKMLSKTYEITELELTKPKGIIIQNQKEHYLNFNDIIEKFTPKKIIKKKEPIHFSIVLIKINEGEFHYQEKLIPISYFIKNVNIESSGIHWNADTIAIKFSFFSGIGKGDMKGNFTFNSKNKDYHLAVVVNKFDLNIVGQYLKQLTNYGSFRANLDADIKSKGNFKDKQDVTTSGLLAINDFHFGKTPKEDYASFEKLVVSIHKLSPKNYQYVYDSIALTHPYFKYERYDYLDNMQTMFGKKGANITAANTDANQFNLVVEIGKYIKVLSKNFFKSHYKINRLAIYHADLKYNDFSTREKFSIELNPLYITADSIDKNHKRVNLFLKSAIKPYGNAEVALSINPKDSSDFDLDYHFRKIPVSMFNSYVSSYTSFPLDRGTIELNGKWSVKNGSIQSNNHLLIIDPRLSTRLMSKDTKWVPMRLIMYFIRERGNVIDYEIPITGNLKDPKFDFRDVIMDAIGNVFIKSVTIPYRVEVKNTEAEIEKSLELKWETRSSTLFRRQKKFIKKMVNYLLANPAAFIKVSPQLYINKEKEAILFFEAKKKYFLLTSKRTTKRFSQSDSERVVKMSIKDSLFVNYLNKQTKGLLLFTVQDKCANSIDSAIVNKKIQQLHVQRLAAFMACFKEYKVASQIHIAANQNVIPYNGFSFYKIDYKNEYPEALMKAYRRMSELDNETPRNKFKRERKQNRRMM